MGDRDICSLLPNVGAGRDSPGWALWTHGRTRCAARPSRTTFLAGAVGSQPGFVDLGEVRPVKANNARWTTLPESDAADELRSTLERIRLLGFVRDLRPVEQTPELSFVV